MKNCGLISSKLVCSERDFIVYSHTTGLLAERNRLDDAKHDWELEVAHYAERGRESDALIFEWSDDHWMMSGNLYDLECAEQHSTAY